MSEATTGTERVLQGTPVSPGIAIAPVHVTARGFTAPEVYAIDPGQVEAEQKRFASGLETTRGELDALQKRISGLSGDDEAKIFEAHMMVLEDPTLTDRVNDAITNRLQNAEYAFYAVMQNFLEAVRRVNDPYLRERTADIDDICQRVLRNLALDYEELPADAEFTARGLQETRDRQRLCPHRVRRCHTGTLPR